MTVSNMIDIDPILRDNSDIFHHMVEWLEEVVGPMVDQVKRSHTDEDKTYCRFYGIEGTGWRYEYKALSFFEDENTPETLDGFRVVDHGRKKIFYSKKIYIDDIMQAVEFRLRW